VLAKIHDKQTIPKKSLKESFLTKQQGEDLILRIIIRRRKRHLFREEEIFDNRE
jgi:hypothetical protein